MKRIKTLINILKSEKGRKRDKERDRETERQRDRETERERERETQRESLENRYGGKLERVGKCSS